MGTHVSCTNCAQRLALADIEAALHHLHLANEALRRAGAQHDALPVLSASFIGVARSRLNSAQMHARKAKEQINGS